jgi:hypothetical protein
VLPAVPEPPENRYSSVDDLWQRILKFIDYFNRTMARPFKWTYAGRPLTA